MPKLALDTKLIAPSAIAIWKSCLPFVENTRGVLIHRPRCVATHKVAERWPSHIAIHYYCGAVATGGRHLTFLTKPPTSAILCAGCERNALKAGLPSADTLAGRHVHIGGVKAFKHCCKEES